MGDLEKGATPPEQTGENKAPRGKGALGGSARDLWDPRAINRYWLDAMSQALDVWMRSHAFLRLMRQGLEMATAFPCGQDLSARRAIAGESDLAANPKTEDPPPPATFHAAPIAPSVAAEPSLPVRAEHPSLPKAKRKIQAKGSKSP